MSAHALPHSATPSAGLYGPAEPLLLAHLNPEQCAAVTLPQGHALILAGAGSGKTRVLTTRIAWLLQRRLAYPSGILAVTFTNKAAKEMLARLSALLPLNTRGMWIGTFHGLCHRLLRTHYQAAALRQGFQILDTQDQLSAIKRLCKQFNVDEEYFAPKQLQSFIAACKEQGQRPHDVPLSPYDDDARKRVELYLLYEQQCQREGVVDFGELMLRSYELLRDNDPLRAHYQRRFSHILIDEFQDTNRLQYLWLKQLAGEEVGGRMVTQASVMAVGDDDQSIYAFRGARVSNMQDFVREFAVPPLHTIKLEQNYRSHGHILHCANELIDHNQGRLGKNLRTSQGLGELVRVFEAGNDFEEARWVAQEIGQLCAPDACPERIEPRNVAILYRSNAQSRVLESQLCNAGIAYRVYGGMRFFERAEIKHALAYLRLLQNPQDDTSFLRVVNFPPRGIGLRTLEQLQDQARAQGRTLYEMASHLPGAAGVKLGQFIDLIDTLLRQTEGQGLRYTIEQMLQHSTLMVHYRSEKDGQDRIENLEELVNAAESFVTQEGFGHEGVTQGMWVDAETGETLSPLAAFLTHAALEAGDNQAQAGQDAVQLMTIHASKGLEFDAVFITGLEEDLFPHPSAISDQFSLEEERRLMYVAITRARKRLYLAHAQSRMLHGQTRNNLASRFLAELPESCLKFLTPHIGTRPQSYRAGAGAGAYGGAKGFGFRASTKGAGGASVALKKSLHGLSVGQAVSHAKFGDGVILALEGQEGNDARAEVRFSPTQGTRWLALAVAKLTPIMP